MIILESALESIKENIINILKKHVPSKIINNIPLSGKMLRTRLGLNISKKYFNNLNDELINAFSAMELVQLASLLHDDVIDGSYIRRNKPTINYLFNNSVAVALGDLVLVTAFEIVEDLNNETLRREFLNVIKNMSEGELLEQLNKGKIAKREDYFEIIRKKSGTLFGIGAAIPAIIAKKDYLDDYKIGEEIGILYQIKDDINDFKDISEIGKTSMLDINNGIISFPILLAIEKDKSYIEKLFNEDKKDKIIEFLEENNIILIANEYFEKRKSSLLNRCNYINNII